MNSKEKPWRWGKRKEERKSNQFLKRNNDNKQRRALIFLLFLSLSPLFFGSRHKGWRHREGRQLRVWRGSGTVHRVL